jgi:hypothetical protein
MTIKLNLKFLIAFIALSFVMLEAHEIVHTSVVDLSVAAGASGTLILGLLALIVIKQIIILCGLPLLDHCLHLL